MRPNIAEGESQKTVQGGGGGGITVIAGITPPSLFVLLLKVAAKSWNKYDFQIMFWNGSIGNTSRPANARQQQSLNVQSVIFRLSIKTLDSPTTAFLS